MPLRTSKIKIDETTVKSVSEFLAIINGIPELSDYAIFRGQEIDKPLIPKIGRIKLKKDFTITEEEMINDFKRLSRPFITKIPTNDWEWLALAQHHGMATRLLDWTTNPLAAMWFAVSKPIKNGNGVLWLLDVPEEYVLKANDTNTRNPFEEKITLIFQPHISSNRISAQNSWFTVHHYSEKFEKFVQFEWNKKYRNYLKKFIITKESFCNIRADLDRLGINRLSLFPDIDGAACYSEWLNSFLEDET